MKWICIGTGRCGTQSLAKIARARHESIHPPWNITKDSKWQHELERLCKWGYAEVNHKLVNKVPMVRNAVRELAGRQPVFPEYGERRGSGILPVVCLHRDMRSTIRSFLEVCGGLSRCHPAGARALSGRYRSSYPQFTGAKDHAEAWMLYWHVCEEFMAQVEPPVFHMNMEELNSDSVCRELFDFLDLDVPLPKLRKHDKVKKMGAKHSVLAPFL